MVGGNEQIDPPLAVGRTGRFQVERGQRNRALDAIHCNRKIARSKHEASSLKALAICQDEQGWRKLGGRLSHRRKLDRLWVGGGLFRLGLVVDRLGLRCRLVRRRLGLRLHVGVIVRQKVRKEERSAPSITGIRAKSVMKTAMTGVPTESWPETVEPASMKAAATPLRFDADRKKRND